MNHQFNLFPETLLVEVSDGKVYTTSLKVAEHFKKPHYDVLKKIWHVIEQSAFMTSVELAGNFSVYHESVMWGKRIREREIYRLSHDGFAILAMSFTGEQAMRWKWDFLKAFRAMERELAALKEREARALYALRPRWQPIVLNPGMSRDDLIRMTGHKSPGSITACRRSMRKVGLLEEAA